MASRRSARTSSPEPLIRFVRVRERGSGWPWTIPALAALEELPLAPGVTFLVGENGSGKSTLIEAIAVAAGFDARGRLAATSASQTRAADAAAARSAAARARRAPAARRLLPARRELLQRDDRDRRSSARRRALRRRVAARAVARRVVPRPRDRTGSATSGLYMLDEPEAALSPQRPALAAAADPRPRRRGGSQFVIATHSPILLALPGRADLRSSARRASARSRTRTPSTSR